MYLSKGHVILWFCWYLLLAAAQDAITDPTEGKLSPCLLVFHGCFVSGRDVLSMKIHSAYWDSWLMIT